MAQIPMDGSGPQVESPQIVGKTASWAGAIVSLGLLIGAGYWGYKLVVRDAHGVPVVRAIEGPMREQPVDPGGLQAAHQGLSVNNVAAEGTAGAPSDRLILAPPPIELNALDAPVADAEIAASLQVSPEEDGSDADASSAPSRIKPGAIEGVLSQLAEDNGETGETGTDVAALSTANDAALETAKEGLGVSLRPKLRPSTFTTSSAATEPAASQPLDVAPESLPAGTRLVQLGAFASDEIARAEWDKLQAKFGDYLGDKKRVVQKASSGGRTFYRLRAMGFADLSDARRLCSALKAENADCIPVVTR